MIAQVRPMHPGYVANSLRHLWGIVLAGSERPRRLAGTRRHYTDPASHSRSTSQAIEELEQPLERATRLIPPARLVTVLTRDAAASAETAFAGLSGLHRCLQPTSRGTAPEVFLASLCAVHEDPHAVIAALPAHHLLEHGPRLLQYVARAAAAAGIRPDLPVIVGASQGSRDPEYAWIEPGEAVEGLETYAVRAVRRFVQRPSTAEYDGTLLGTLAVVTNARTLLALGRRHLPDVLECLEPLEDVVGHPEETLLCDAVWESMPRASLSRDLLAHLDVMGVVSMPDAMTGEWVRPAAHALAS